MPKMTPTELKAFGANAGSISIITERESTRDRSVTLDRHDKAALHMRYPDGSFARKGGAESNGNPDYWPFMVNPHNSLTGARPRDIYVVHPKSSSSELRLYTASTELAFATGDYFYIFVRKGEPRPFIGTISAQELERVRSGNVTAYEEFARTTELVDDDEDPAYQLAIGAAAAKLPVGTVGLRYPRDPKVAVTALEKAGFNCEAAIEGRTHDTFRVSASGRRYVEAHHLVPMARQGDFEAGLDIPENIIALCPTCHRRLHHAVPEERIDLLLSLFAKRSSRLEKRGVKVSEADLLAAYGIDSAAILECLKSAR